MFYFQFLKSYLIIVLFSISLFLFIGWYQNYHAYQRLEEKVITDCVWLDFVGVVPDYCQEYIDEGMTIYER